MTAMASVQSEALNIPLRSRSGPIEAMPTSSRATPSSDIPLRSRSGPIEAKTRERLTRGPSRRIAGTHPGVLGEALRKSIYPPRKDALVTMTNEKLESVFAQLLANRVWPDEHPSPVFTKTVLKKRRESPTHSR